MLYVFLGAGFGGIMRYVISLIIKHPAGVFPVVTLCINLVGCLMIGVLHGYFTKYNFMPEIRLLCITGLLGGFTTFSSFSLENISLLQQGFYLQALCYSMISVCGGIILCGFGLFLSR